MERTLCSTLLACAALLPPGTQAAPLGEASSELQLSWEVVRCQTPAGEREKRFKAPAGKAHQTTDAFPGRSETLIWEGMVVSSLAGEKRGFSAVGLVKQAKSLVEQALQIDANARDGSAYNCLGMLYYKVPGWPLSFGDKAKSRDLLLKALAVNPMGADSNHFYGEFLFETGQPEEALTHLEQALQAPTRPGPQIADTGRQEEARQLLAKIRAR